MARLGLAAAATIVALVLGELAVRAFVPPRPMVVWEQFADLAERINAVPAEEIFVNDPELFWRLTPNLERPDSAGPLFGTISNSQGLREDHEIPKHKGEGEVRLLFLGDSCTFGEHLSHTESFVQGVEDTLRSSFPDVGIECINAGVPGYTLFQGWRFLETQGYEYEPDVVVLYFAWNEGASWGDMSDAEHYEALQAQRPIPLLQWSRICQLLWLAAAKTSASAEDEPRTRQPRPRLHPDEFRDLLSRVHESTRGRGVELLLLAGPHRNNIARHIPRARRSPYQSQVYDSGMNIAFGPDQSHGYVDTVPAIQAMARDYPTSALFHDHVHPTALTNRRIAGLVAAKLDPWLRAHLKEPQ